MQKPNNYDSTQASGDFTPIELGGHILEIKQVEEMTSRTGKPMLKISFDFAREDVQPEYFADSFRNDIRPEKKWPNAGTSYILTQDEEGKCSRSFKTFTTSVEKSNPGFKVVWGDAFCQSLKGKTVGGVFGVVEEEYNGKVHRNRKLRWFRSSDGVKDAAIPEDKLLPNSGYGQPAPGTAGFMDVPDILGDELPFN